MNTVQRLVGRLMPYRVLFAVAGGIIALDQLTKFLVAHVSGLELGAYPPFGGYEIIPGLFSIVYSTNTGAAWGMFAGYGILLALLGIGAVTAIVLMRRHLELERKPMQWIFGLMTGGIIGNIVDRAVHGHVIDFLDVHWGPHHWPTFNVADSGITLGVILYLLISFRIERAGKKRMDNVRLY